MLFRFLSFKRSNFNRILVVNNKFFDTTCFLHRLNGLVPLIGKQSKCGRAEESRMTRRFLGSGIAFVGDAIVLPTPIRATGYKSSGSRRVSLNPFVSGRKRERDCLVSR